jgi:hypothetical protein
MIGTMKESDVWLNIACKESVKFNVHGIILHGKYNLYNCKYYSCLFLVTWAKIVKNKFIKIVMAN